MRILFCGGGTAGHVTPALAMADAYAEKYKDLSVAFVGREGGEENKAILNEGHKLYTVKIQGLKRKLTADNFIALINAVKALRLAEKIIREFNPHIVIGTGGYVCWPVLKKAHSLKIPVFLHESNAYPGLVTRLLSSKCDRVLLSYENAAKYLKTKKNVSVIGTPIRKGFLKISKKESRRRLGINGKDTLIISFGGSGGSEKINEAVVNLMKDEIDSNVIHIHGCGRKYYEKIKAEHPELCTQKGNLRILPYIENMPLLLRAADITVTRCGAMTLAELSACGCCSILIPSPNVTANHQYENARALEEAGAAILIGEEGLSGELLSERIKPLIDSVEKRESYQRAIKRFYNKGFEKQLFLITEDYKKHFKN